MKKMVGFIIVLLALMLFSGQVMAEFYVIPTRSGVGTSIASLPYTIEKSGFYYLSKELTSTGEGIIVNADHVTIDLMGFGLTGSGSGIGINMASRSNVEIRNGTVRGFSEGIQAISAGDNFRVLNVRLMDNTGRGMHLVGHSFTIRGCQAEGNNTGISVTGSNGLIVNNISSNNDNDGISATGDNFNMLNNVVVDNGGNGFHVSSVCTSCNYLFNLNMVNGNTGGNLNGSPPLAVYGLNVGIP